MALTKVEVIVSAKENPLDIEAEYKELEYEKTVEDWRYA